MKFDVVIAGGGFAGAYCARELGRLLGRRGLKRVALVAERNMLVFQPLLAEVAGSSLSPADVVNPLRQLCRGVNVLQGAIQRIDWAKKELVLDGGRFTRNHIIAFDHLVLALGTVTDLTRVPGMAEYSWPMKHVADALRLRAALINRMEEANLVEDPATRRRLLTFVVVGGNFTGVATAGQLLAFARQARRYYANLRRMQPRVVLVHSHAHLMEQISSNLGDYARKVLKRRGMEVRVDTRVVSVNADRVVFDDGSAIETNTVVSTVGNAPNPIVMNLCKHLRLEANRGRIAVEPTMRVPGQTHLWAIGDCAAVPWNDRGTPKIAPPTARQALRQGTQLARNLSRALRGQPLRPFRYRYIGQVATIGAREAVAELFGLHFRGFFAWWLWRTVYLSKLPGVMRKLRVLIAWCFDLFFPRDLSLHLPPPDDNLRSVHLHKDECLFVRGHECQAFFYVRHGALKLTRPGASDQVIGPGEVIDENALAADGCWDCEATALENSDVVALRGSAFNLFRTELHLVPRQRAAAPGNKPDQSAAR